MAQIRIDLAETLVDGMDIKFKAPCACNEITGLIVYYPAEDDTIKVKELVFRDSHGNDLTGIGNLFSKDAYVKVIADTVNGYAYLQNADNNGYLNSAIFGTYTHDAENLIGSGENGKFKATVSGTISNINVNGVSCSVKCGEDSTMDLIAGCWYTFILDGNTVNFSSGGAGGGGLNFKVVKNPEPASPSENMIWVNTDADITGYYFQSEQPEGMAEGEVWISTGTESQAAFNALKKGTIMVYPLAAKQMQGGTLVDVTAKSWQDGAWVEWIRGIYDGNWKPGYGFEPLDNTTLGIMTINNESNPAELLGNPDGGYVQFGGVIANIDVTDYSSIEICSEWTGDQWLNYGISDNKSYSGQNAGMLAFINKGTKYEKTTETINVSELSGVYYFKVQGITYVNASFKLYSLNPIK